MTIKQPLARLEQVDLRDVWETEAGDFTPWLAEEDNIALLSETIGLDLEVEAQEKEVGPFRADILCKDSDTGEWVLIENQLERTDHRHLGQLITYSAGLKAATIIWIADQFTEEHRAALDWLNEISDERFRFFGLEVQAWRIGDSRSAPKFNIVSKPNDWSRNVAGSAARLGVGELSDAKLLQLEFWTAFRDLLDRQETQLRPRVARASHSLAFPIGRSGFWLSGVASTWSPDGHGNHELRAEFSINHKMAASAMSLLERDRAAIEREVGGPLTWYSTEGVAKRRIYASRPADLNDRSAWAEYHEWLATNLERLYGALRDRVKSLDLSGDESEAAE